jgi:hypothetical protein
MPVTNFLSGKPTLRLLLDRPQVPVRRIKTLHVPPLDLVFADHIFIVGDDSELDLDGRGQKPRHGFICKPTGEPAVPQIGSIIWGVRDSQRPRKGLIPIRRN